MTKPQVNCYYQHRYGGLYIVRDIAFSTVDQSKWVVYAHCYPFEYQVWVRPYNDWTTEGKFRMLEPGEYDRFLREKDQVEFQAEITETKLREKSPKPAEGDTAIVNGKTSDFKDGKWVTMQG